MNKLRFIENSLKPERTMGTWGTGIFQNDTTADIWVEFKELYNKGLSPKDIRLKLEKEYSPQSDTEYYAEIWTGIAYGQWMCGELEDYTFKKLSDATKLKWQTLWMEDKKDLDKRIKAITDFIEKIKTPRPTALKRKKVVVRPIIYKKGDVIALKIDDEKYLAAVVDNHDDHSNTPSNTIIFTDLVFIEQPTQQQILNAHILYLDIGGHAQYHRGYFNATFTTKNMARKAKDTIKIGEIPVKDYLWLGVGVGIGDWNRTGTLYLEQLEFLKNNKSDRPFPVTVKDLLTKDKELETKLIDWDKKIFMEKAKR
ncbi:MAG: hypothetical protein J7621_02540 [Niastella sp.]|nr:hypothetical protein [Niastella sp.]